MRLHSNYIIRHLGSILAEPEPCGDHDMCVPFTGTQAWTRSLGYNITDQWRAWYFDDQVAGYTQGYDYNLTFVTVKGSGHTVAEYKPKEALALYSRWLVGQFV
ncbi:hypothetical protein HPP92_009720 [Vanilla planifolia]|uniref:Uncharacterized protein n=1 Tax=Vanilla planifolia TaxID=51239 RepID=A0A835R8N4_VANPL|nr:hypothetical protein HPP92_009720 [Vanilla planifolia]